MAEAMNASADRLERYAKFRQALEGVMQIDGYEFHANGGATMRGTINP